MASPRKFKANLGKFADKVNLDLAQFRRRITLGLKEKVERKSPVDTGRLRSSWAVSDSIPSAYLPGEGVSNGLGPVEATFTKPFDSSFITSNLAYVTKIEFGYSGQSPQGMVRVSLAEMVTELEGAFGEL